jgi:hypothetical protein
LSWFFGGTLFVFILNKGMVIIFMLEKEIDERRVFFFEISFLQGNPVFSSVFQVMDG